jgi:hypothetical protein
MLDYSKQIPANYWDPRENAGALILDQYKGRTIDIYLPFGYTAEEMYDIFYFKMGTNNTAQQFWSFPGHTKRFEHVIDNLIDNGEIRPCVIVSIQGERPGRSKWLPENLYGLICYVEGRVMTYAKKNADLIIESAPHRALGGWSLGAIECRNVLVDDRKNEFWKMIGWFNMQSGYNANGMQNISGTPFVGCAAGGYDDAGCVMFTKTCANIFGKTERLKKNHAQIVPGYTHAIDFQVRYFYNAIRYFFKK